MEITNGEVAMGREEDSLKRVGGACDDWQSLERLYQAFPSTLNQRRTWRTAAQLIDKRLQARGHQGLPALIPGLVHARVATALLAAGYRTEAQLATSSFLCLGCHAGLEVRILRDFGARSVHGVEIRGEVVQEALRARLVDSSEVTTEDFWTYLAAEGHELFDNILVLAPEALSLQRLWRAVIPHLAADGRLAVVAQPADLRDFPLHIPQGAALEGTMQWYALMQGTIV